MKGTIDLAFYYNVSCLAICICNYFVFVFNTAYFFISNNELRLQAELTPWVSSKHNMGMAFNRSVWQEIRQCAEFFCNYDDYNWDWSLQKVSQGCMSHKLHAVVMRGPRVFHVGEWCEHILK